MTPRMAALWLAGSLLATVAVAQDTAPVPLLPDRLRWVSPPNLSGVQVVWVLGAESTPGPYCGASSWRREPKFRRTPIPMRVTVPC